MLTPNIELIEKKVDIYQLPSRNEVHVLAEGALIALGDLHANTMKLIFMLILFGVITNMSQEDFKQLVQIYTARALTKSSIEAFEAILKNKNLNFQQKIKVLLIGDEVGDRGKNDGLTLITLFELFLRGIELEILLSNHGIEFIIAYEKGKEFTLSLLQIIHGGSMERLNQSIQSGAISKEKVFEMIEKAYKPNLRVLSYSLDKENNAITLYSHAPIGLDNIEALAAKLGVNYIDTTAEDLARTIDKINAKFQNYVNANKVHTLFDQAKLQEGYRNIRADLRDDPFSFVMYNRRYDFLNRPANHHNYRVNFVHGHDPDGYTMDNVVDLDDFLGKGLKFNQGTFAVIYSHVNERPLQETATSSSYPNTYFTPVWPLALSEQFYSYQANYKNGSIAISCPSDSDQVSKLYQYFNHYLPGLLSLNQEENSITVNPVKAGVGGVSLVGEDENEKFVITFPEAKYRNFFMLFLGLDMDPDNADKNYQQSGYEVGEESPNKLYLSPQFFNLHKGKQPSP